jgi:subfamily B ATP-binding cassette protein HlyB/CyaB
MSGRFAIAIKDFVWALGSACALNRKPFDPNLLLQQIPPPYTTDSVVEAARALGLRVKRVDCDVGKLSKLTLPCVVLLRAEEPMQTQTAAAGTAAMAAGLDARTASESVSAATSAVAAISTSGPSGAQQGLPEALPAIVAQVDEEKVTLFRAGGNTASVVSRESLGHSFLGVAFLIAPAPAAVNDPDGVSAVPQLFGFRWFIPELLKHRRVWRDVLAASLVIQLLALGTPLFTQLVIDKVVVHRTHSTLIVVAVGLAVFMLFTALLTWVRQYLILHTGNRVDAVLGAAVFNHLLKLPPRYFEHRPTGVIAARLRGVETIREFVASAAVTLILDLPFAAIFIAIMFAYSVQLTVIALGIIAVIIAISLVVAPVFRSRLNEQFLLGARNQAFVTEYVAGMDTVKSLQMEPGLRSRYSDYLAQYLHSGFTVRQVANTYNVLANGLEQAMMLLLLVCGAELVMGGSEFTIGMLVAFQMFAGRVSQPMLRIVGLWQQFQQASLSVQRLGDIMNAPAETYSLVPARGRGGNGLIEFEAVSFRYGEQLPLLFENLNLKIAPGNTVAVMGPSGSGKSTLAKLLQGLYWPSAGAIKLDGTDTRYLAVNELRQQFGVVPQETILFSGTVYDNLLMANSLATFDDIVKACRAAEIHEVIEKLPHGYQTEIGERGVGLSGGQKQRLAIARALLKQPKILVFDEATSSLDSATAEHFCATINQLRGKVTILFIAHALPKTLQVDALFEMGNTGLRTGDAGRLRTVVTARGSL